MQWRRQRSLQGAELGFLFDDLHDSLLPLSGLHLWISCYNGFPLLKTAAISLASNRERAAAAVVVSYPQKNNSSFGLHMTRAFKPGAKLLLLLRVLLGY